MNDRIRELAEQANIKYSTRDDDFYSAAFDGVHRPDMELFVQLIVRECADICNKIYFDRYPDAEDFERSEEGDAIKQHFGVEE